MRLLANPVFIRMAAALLAAVAAFVGGIVLIRILRREMVADATPTGSDSEALPLHAAEVIQELKQQKFALQSEQKTERRRAKTSEHITAAMIANLPCGILFVTPNGLVRQANAAARQILGFASPLGMNFSALFRDARVISEIGVGVRVAEQLDAGLREQSALGHFAIVYVTPSNEDRTLKLTLMPATGTSGETLGLAIAITDQNEMAELRRAELLRTEISAEMALELRTSVASIREWAEQIGMTENRQGVQRLASDVAAEAERLEITVGSFLAGRENARAAQA